LCVEKFQSFGNPQGNIELGTPWYCRILFAMNIFVKTHIGQPHDYIIVETCVSEIIKK
jgi:hypothetical protein